MELVNLYKTNRILFEERMKEKRYQIARGVCMPLGFGSSRMIVYQNCTDELAIEFCLWMKKTVSILNVCLMDGRMMLQNIWISCQGKNIFLLN